MSAEREGGREFPSFKLFCTEAFQFDYEAPFHRGWMLRAIQNEIEPSVGWTGSLPVSPPWGHQGTARAMLPRHALSLQCLVGLQGKCDRGQVAGFVGKRVEMIDTL